MIQASRWANDHTGTSKEDIRQVWDRGGTAGRSDLQRAAVNTLYKPIQKVYSDFRYFFRATSNPIRSPLGEIGWSGRRDAAQDKSWNATKPKTRQDKGVNLTHYSQELTSWSITSKEETLLMPVRFGRVEKIC